MIWCNLPPELLPTLPSCTTGYLLGDKHDKFIIIVNVTNLIQTQSSRYHSGKFIQLWRSIHFFVQETEITKWISISFSNQRGFLFLPWSGIAGGEDIKSPDLLASWTLNLLVSVGMVFMTLWTMAISQSEWIPGERRGDYLWTRQMLTPRLLFQLIVPQPLIYGARSAKRRGEIIVILLTWLNIVTSARQQMNT